MSTVAETVDLDLIKKFCVSKNPSFLSKLSIPTQEKFLELAKELFYEKKVSSDIVNVVLCHFLKSENRRDMIIKNFNDLIIWQKQEKESGYVFKIRNYKKLIDCLEGKFIPDWKTAQTIIFNCFSNPTSLYEKLKEIWETGSLERFNNEENDAIRNITNIQWIGPVKAKKLYDAGCRTIKDVQFMYDTDKITLTDAQSTALFYIHDTHEIVYTPDKGVDKEIVKPRRIPREEIDVLNDIFKRYQNDQVDIKIVGSYRRKLPSSGDIDVLITSTLSNFNVHEIVENLRKHLDIVKIVEGPSKFLGYIKIDKYYRRIDILLTSQEEYPFSVLYFTGSKEFNVRMRAHALKMGYSMNEHGLTSVKGDIVDTSNIKTELDIFKFLKFPYVKPSERV